MTKAPLPRVVLDSGGGCRLRVRVRPKGPRDEIVGVYGDSLKLTVREAPEDGKANRAVCVLLARLLSVDLATVEVVAGAGSQNKTVRIGGLAPEECLRRLCPYT
jgi:uncharacterized protein (TIGR00251 family)